MKNTINKTLEHFTINRIIAFYIFAFLVYFIAIPEDQMFEPLYLLYCSVISIISHVILFFVLLVKYATQKE
jgi:hypothetical protein